MPKIRKADSKKKKPKRRAKKPVLVRRVGADHDSPLLFDRIVSILEQARANVVQAVNTGMVIAYWHIGREIVEERQGGEERADYGKKVLEKLSLQLLEKYGQGFSVANLKSFRQFYQVYSGRLSGIRYLPGSELQESKKLSLPGRGSAVVKKSHPSGGEFANGFSPHLSWSHYRALMRVINSEARDFYEKEAVECGWSKAQLERQIQTAYYERILENKGQKGLLPDQRKRQEGEHIAPIDTLKSPYILEFLDLPDSPALHERDLEQAIINNLQSFLLELGKGFSFVARQKHIRFDDEDFYVDLVFYNFILKCFLLIDLKIGKLTHADVGQMDGYVRLFEDQMKDASDNPTIGLILCSEKGEAVAKYSVLKENRQIFASKYLKFLPSEKELQREIVRERALIEHIWKEKADEA